MSTSDTTMPYIGLVPYSEKQAALFFGREDDQDIITANLISERLTLLYGASGVGKSSVLRAGVEHQLKELAARNIQQLQKPKHVVAVFSAWREQNLVRSLLNLVEKSVRSTMKGSVVEGVSSSLALAPALGEWTKRVQGQLLIILDQFEEYFLYHQNEDGKDTFARQFPDAVNATGLPVNFLISFREDALSKLDYFKVRMPSLFGNFLRIDHLTREAGIAAIKKPLDYYNEEIRKSNGTTLPLVGIENDLVNEVLKQVKVGEKYIGEAGLGGLEEDSSPTEKTWRIETPYLQLVMTRLWEEEQRINKNVGPSGAYKLRLETLNNLQGAKRIVRTHLESVMSGLSASERDLAAGIFKHLVTPSGTKIAQTVSDLASYSRLSPAKTEQLGNMMLTLSSGDKRIFRDVPPPEKQKDVACYEVFHDRLAEAILEWQRRYGEKQRRARWVRIAAGLVGLVIVLLAFSAFALTQRQQAVAQERIARNAQQRAEESARMAVAAKEDAESQRAIAVDANRETAYANELLKKAQSLLEVQNSKLKDAQSQLQAKNDALKKAIDEANKARTVAQEEAGKANRATEVALAAEKKLKEQLDLVHEIDSSNAYYKAVLRGHSGNVNSAIFSEDGNKVLSLSDDKTARVWKIDAPEDERVASPLALPNNETGDAAFSPDSRFVVMTTFSEANRDARIAVWDVSQKTPQIVDQVVFPARENYRLLAIHQPRFSPDGRQVMAIVEGLGLVIWPWDSTQRKFGRNYSSLAAESGRMTVSPDGRYLVTSKGYVLDVWEIETRRKVRSFPPDYVPLGFSVQGKYVVMLTDTEDLKIRSLQTGDLVTSFTTGDDANLVSATISPNEKYLLLVTSGDNKAQLFDLTNPLRLRVTFSGHTGNLTGAMFSPDGGYVVTFSADKTARVWDSSDKAIAESVSTDKAMGAPPSASNIGSGKLIAELRGHTGAVNSAVFDRTGRYVVTAGDDKTARVWNVADDALIVSVGTSALETDWTDRGSTAHGSFDFDVGERLFGPIAREADVSLDVPKDGGSQISPGRGARIVNIGSIDFQSLTIAELQGLNYSIISLSQKELATGSVFAVLTTQGNYAKVQVVEFGGTLKFRWVTYKLKPAAPKRSAIELAPNWSNAFLGFLSYSDRSFLADPRKAQSFSSKVRPTSRAKP